VVPEHTDEEQARIALASELRRGMHLLVGREPSVNAMTRLTGSSFLTNSMQCLSE
jgi:hypothetical protein